MESIVRKCSFFAIVLVAILHCTAGQDIVVSTTTGEIRGGVETARNGSTFYAFKGIPYAENPQRFSVAQPKQPWIGIRDGRKYGAVCPQLGLLGLLSGNEDCLFLNVFYPTEDRCGADNKLPVLFHTHGGSFTSGSGDLYNPKFLMDECIVYVAINYRLGAVGFLTTLDEILPGNLGLKDALLALKWTRDNLANFRGDKDAITINGISAGGGIVSHFVASPATRGLFARAIAQSGTSIAPPGVFLETNPKRFARELGELFNCQGESSLELRDCLRAVPIKDIVVQQGELAEWYCDASKFLPTVEAPGTTDAFLVEDPYLTFKHGRQNRVPYIIGTVKDEGLAICAGPTLAVPEALEDLNTNWYDRAPFVFRYHQFNLTQAEKNEISDKVKDFYFQNRTVSQETAQALVDVETDRYFAYGAYEESLLHSKYAPTYQYDMTYVGDFDLLSITLGLDYVAVTHGHDGPYLFKMYTNLIVPDPLPGSERLYMSNNMIKLWLSFVKTGVPTETYGDVGYWRPFTSTRPSTFMIELPPANLYGDRKERMDFWDSLRLREKQYPEEFNH